ncbi:hypothetical protein ACRRTK_001734 [Alexandromys fortis]
MILDSMALIVKVQLPAYLKQPPVPDSITAFPASQFQNGSACCPSLVDLHFLATLPCVHSSRRRNNRRIA